MKYIHNLAMISALLELATASSLPSWGIACTVSPVVYLPEEIMAIEATATSYICAASETKRRCFSSTILQADVADPTIKCEAVFGSNCTRWQHIMEGLVPRKKSG